MNNSTMSFLLLLSVAPAPPLHHRLPFLPATHLLDLAFGHRMQRFHSLFEKLDLQPEQVHFAPFGLAIGHLRLVDDRGGGVVEGGPALGAGGGMHWATAVWSLIATGQPHAVVEGKADFRSRILSTLALNSSAKAGCRQTGMQ